MNTRTFLQLVTVLAGSVLLAGIGVLFFGSSDQIARVPSSVLLASAVVTLAGTIYLHATKPQVLAAQKSKSTLSTIGFAILVVIAFFLVGFFMTHH